MNFLQRILRYSDKKDAELLNYPSTGVLKLMLLVAMFAGVTAFFGTLHICGHTLEGFLPQFGIATVLGVILFSYIVYRLQYLPIKHYETHFGKTGLGDKFLKRWEDKN